MSQTSRADARSIFDAAVAAAMPAAAMKSADLSSLKDAVVAADKIIVVGGGKAGAGMVTAFESIFAQQLDRINGIVNVPDDQVVSTQRIQLNPARPFGKNEPTREGQAGVEQMLQLLASATSKSVVIVLLSGGGSALMPAPARGIDLADKLHVTRLLSESGASIQEFNCVRKHISKIKGGRLAEAAQNANSIWSLIISDVVGDPLDVIASGPTAPDPTTFADARAIIVKYGLDGQVPSVFDYLSRGVAEEFSETPKTLPSKVHNLVIANNATALRAAKQKAMTLEYHVTTINEPVVGDVGAAAPTISAKVRSLNGPRSCLLFGGETTVNVGNAQGIGGRNQELALRLVTEFSASELQGITILCAGTDGEDGPTNAAGACVDDEIWSRRSKHSSKPKEFLENHDSYTFFAPIGGLVQTGLTGTNVMDVGIILVNR